MEFLATIAPVATALSISNSDGGARLKLDVDESQLLALYELMAWRGELLRISVERTG